MTVYEIKCDTCKELIGYTTRKPPQGSTNYLFSKKLTLNQRGAFYDRRKCTICIKCFKQIYMEEKITV